jgi:hypothetical protein
MTSGIIEFARTVIILRGKCKYVVAKASEAIQKRLRKLDRYVANAPRHDGRYTGYVQRP